MNGDLFPYGLVIDVPNIVVLIPLFIIFIFLVVLLILVVFAMFDIWLGEDTSKYGFWKRIRKMFHHT